jgi:methylenetetrahydrofolate reductase (NADPH)
VFDPRFEILPFARGEEEAARLTVPAHLTVTCSPKHGLDHTLDVAERIRVLGHRVTVHLAARMVRGAGHLDELLGRMAAARIEDSFVIGGDATAPEGPFVSAVDLLPLVHEHSNRPKTIGIGGYPEGHPLIADAQLEAALVEKAPYADYVTTQLCFDAQSVLLFARSAPLPVIAGIPGVVDRKKLLEISARVGVGPSLRYLRKQGGVRNLLRLSRGTAESLHRTLAQDAETIAGFHYFTFNRLVETWNWSRGHDRQRQQLDVSAI